MSSKQPRPEPVVVNTVCSLCDEPWDEHGDNPTTLDCIRLLKAKPHTTYSFPQYPNTVPYVYPNTWPYRWYTSGGEASGTYCGHSSQTTTNYLVGEHGSSVVLFKRPDDPEDPPALVPVAV